MSTPAASTIKVHAPGEKAIASRSAWYLRVTFAGREVVRGLLALSALIMVGGTIWFAYAGIEHHQWLQAKDWLQIVLPGETAILGSALGFYFGSLGAKVPGK
jgi:hypothetical protein